MKAHGRAPQIQFPRRKNLTFPGFTLIELLVVIAIIALLLSIGLPAMQKAKQAAQKVVCTAHLKGYGTALGVYNTNNEDWLPGPNTSGIRFNDNVVPAEADTSPTYPVQNMDWASPMLGDDLGLPAERDKRLIELLNTELRCPANKKKYDDFHPSGSEWISGLKPSDIYYSSYSAALGFHVYSGQDSGYSMMTSEPDAVVAGYRSSQNSLKAVIDDSRITVKVELPRGYRPKISRIGTPGMKIFVMDGARFVNDEETVTFNAFAKQIDGGNFMLYGPSIPNAGDPFVLTRGGDTKPENLRFGWRHNRAFNGLFFDGHVETLTVEESLKTRYYFPKGSYINDASRTQDPDDGNGRIM